MCVCVCVCVYVCITRSPSTSAAQKNIAIAVACTRVGKVRQHVRVCACVCYILMGVFSIWLINPGAQSYMSSSPCAVPLHSVLPLKHSPPLMLHATQAHDMAEGSVLIIYNDVVCSSSATHVRQSDLSRGFGIPVIASTPTPATTVHDDGVSATTRIGRPGQYA